MVETKVCILNTQSLALVTELHKAGGCVTEKLKNIQCLFVVYMFTLSTLNSTIYINITRESYV